MSVAYVETFGEIVDDVLLDRFKSSIRSRAKRAVNARYAHVWALEDWTFKYAIGSFTTSSTSPTLTVPADFGVPLALWDDQGGPVPFLDASVYQGRYLTAGSGTPEAYTIVGGSVLLGPSPSSDATWTGWYRKRLTLLSEEPESPLIPVEFRHVLVHGGRAELGAAYTGIDASDMEQQFQLDLDAMRREYLTDAEGQPAVWGSDPTVRVF